jgi:undecaprenyl-diphosphatase
MTREDRVPLAALTLGVLAFLLLAALVMADTTHAVDHGLLSWLHVPGEPASPVFSDWLVDPMTDITALGGYTALTLLTLGAALYYALLRNYVTAVTVVLAIASSGLVTHLLKLGIDRMRPDLVEHLTHSANASFPSGHALQATAAFLIIGALAAQAQQNPRIKALILVGAALLIFLVGISRVYLGVHWPTDVVAGWCLGTAWAGLWWLVLRRVSGR